jgi:acylphosphatase
MATVTRRYLVRGRVQGVGFRDYTRRVALRHGVTGWVRNLADGRTVEVVATGERAILQPFEEAIGQGPGGSYISEFRAEDYPDVRMDGFEIRV